MNKKTQVINGVTWTNEFPIEEGDYWFYGYRYGKISCGYPSNPEYMRVKVRMDATKKPMYIADGQFMGERETEEAWFTPMNRPEPPKLLP